MLNTNTHALNAPATAAILAKSVATTLAKAKTLFRDGYTAKPINRPFVYTVTSPEGVVYSVDVKGETCTCAMFARGGTCKHLIAVRYRFLQAIAFLAPVRPVREATLRYEFWGESHDTPRVWRLVPTDRPDSAGRVFRSEEAAREWARGANVRIAGSANVPMTGWN